MGDHSVHSQPIFKGETKLLRNWKRKGVGKHLGAGETKKGGVFPRNTQ